MLQKEEQLVRPQEMKKDCGKIMMELIPYSLYKSVGKVLTYGANKYTPNGWRDVTPDRYIGALLRHLTEYLEDPYSVDEESKMLHIEHLLCNAVFLNDFVQEDLYAIKKEELSSPEYYAEAEIPRLFEHSCYNCKYNRKYPFDCERCVDFNKWEIKEEG